MPLLDVQRRMAEIGRVRIGMKNERGLPTKLNCYRITSQSKDVVDAVAALYGGVVQEWQPPKGPKQWEVITTSNSLDVVVAPGQVLTQWWEKWRGGSCERRCDGVTEQLTDKPCMCPADLEDRKAAASQKVPAACRPVTRFSFMIRDCPVLGLFRIESRGEQVAMELSGVSMFLEAATQNGLFIPATLVLHERGVGTPHQYVVPVLQIKGSYTQIAEALGGMNTPQSLQSGAAPVPVPALPAGGEGGVATPDTSGSTVSSSPSNGRPSLPAAPRGRAPKVALPADRPPLPDDPSFRFADHDAPVDAEVVPEKPSLKVVPPPPSDPFEGLDDGMPVESKRPDRGPTLAMRARDCGIDDDLRHDLIGYVTGGRTTSGSEVSDAEAGELFKLFSEVKRGRKVLSYDPDGKLVVS